MWFLHVFVLLFFTVCRGIMTGFLGIEGIGGRAYVKSMNEKWLRRTGFTSEMELKEC